MIEIEFVTEDAQARSLCERYWQTDAEGDFVGTVKEIAEDVGLSSSELLQVVRESCYAFAREHECSRCGERIEVTSRSDYKSKFRHSARPCPACLETERREERLHAEREVEEQKASLREAYDYPIPSPPEPESLSLAEAVYLLSLVRVGASEDLDYIARLVDFETPLTPWPEFDIEVVEALRERGLIDIHPGSHVGAFEFEEGMPVRYYPRSVHWRPLIGADAPEIRNYLDQLERMFRDMDWPESWLEQTVDLWRLVARYECLEYLADRLNEHNIPFELGERSISVVDGLLKSFSVSQIYNIIWGRVRDATAFLSRTPAKRIRGAEYAVVSMQKFGDRAAAEGWDLKKYGRSWALPVSMVAEVLYNTALQLDGFNELPA